MYVLGQPKLHSKTLPQKNKKTIGRAQVALNTTETVPSAGNFKTTKREKENNLTPWQQSAVRRQGPMLSSLRKKITFGSKFYTQINKNWK